MIAVKRDYQTDVQHRFHASEEVKDSSFAVVD